MRRMRMVVPVLAAGVWIFAAERLLAQATANPDAMKAAESWLALVDDGKYGESWRQAASVFQDKVSLSRWQETLRTGRSPLGHLVSRQVSSAQFTRTLPGAPDGEYVVIHYRTEFENKKSSVETVTPTKDKDGTWRIAGYFIQ